MSGTHGILHTKLGNLYWGGDATGKFQPFVMKAIALPATIYTG